MTNLYMWGFFPGKKPQAEMKVKKRFPLLLFTCIFLQWKQKTSVSVHYPHPTFRGGCCAQAAKQGQDNHCNLQVKDRSVKVGVAFFWCSVAVSPSVNLASVASVAGFPHATHTRSAFASWHCFHWSSDDRLRREVCDLWHSISTAFCWSWKLLSCRRMSFSHDCALALKTNIIAISFVEIL